MSSPEIASRFVAILEDDSGRAGEMIKVVQENFPPLETAVFARAEKMIEWLRENLGHVRLISLDHDLFPEAGTLTPPGSGMEVAEWLSAENPVCPVIIHSANGQAAQTMKFILEMKGGESYRVIPYPFENLEWINSAWLPLLQQLLSHSSLS